MSVKEYSLKPTVVQAIKWTGENIDDMMEFCPKTLWCDPNGQLSLDTLDGEVRVCVGDYVSREENGEFSAIIGSDFETIFQDSSPSGNYQVNSKFKLGDIGYGISQKRVADKTPCKCCSGIGEVTINGFKFICQRCYGSGREPNPVLRWYVDPEPLTVIMIKASISKYQTTFKYKTKNPSGTPYNRGDTTLFLSMDEAQKNCDKRNESPEAGT